MKIYTIPRRLQKKKKRTKHNSIVSFEKIAELYRSVYQSATKIGTT